jgi:hydrogenase maturation protein HypF
MKYRKLITIKGIVQGVGFRPFIYNLARNYKLMGYILNNASGVLIDIEGERASIDAFMDEVKTNPPPQAVIFEIQIDEVELFGYDKFVIRKGE